MKQAAKNGHKGLHLLAELSKQAASIGHLGDLHYQRYYHKGEYRDPEQTGMDWVKESLAMFLWIVGGPQSFSQVEN
jgi:hypothetical protein